MSTVAKAMNAQLQCTKKGGPFEIVKVPAETPGPKDVLIRQRAIAINPVDQKLRDWGLNVTDWPRVFGIEGAGIIEAVGSEVTAFAPGDEAMAWAGSGASPAGLRWGGSFQEMVAVGEHLLGKKPKNISFEEAASLP
jgi:NADPH:quinone reductase-like Zn-dependent oxidoreductase